jgi:hypothetical protein
MIEAAPDSFHVANILPMKQFPHNWNGQQGFGTGRKRRGKARFPSCIADAAVTR